MVFTKQNKQEIILSLKIFLEDQEKIFLKDSLGSINLNQNCQISKLELKSTLG